MAGWETIVGTAALVLLAFLLLQAALSVQILFSRIMDTASLERERLNLFRKRAEAVLDRAQAAHEKNELSWNGVRKFEVERRVFENPNKDICSFYLVPHDKRPIPQFKPGQYLMFDLRVPGEDGSLVRCYSLSDSPTHADHYRVSIKRADPPPGAEDGTPPGRSSSYFHDEIEEGSIVDVFAPSGAFCLNTESRRPVVLIAGGVGLTPLVSMLTLIAETQPWRTAWFFYGVRNRGEHAMYESLQRLARDNANIHVVVAYSRPDRKDRKGVDYDEKGRLSAKLIASYVDISECEFYMCGRTEMMSAIENDLIEFGAQPDLIEYEAFTPPPPPKSDIPEEEDLTDIRVEFARSKKVVYWRKSARNLLVFARKNGLKPDCSCEAGTCGRCNTVLKSGEVNYINRIDEQKRNPGCELICSCEPKTDVILDL